MNPPEDLIGPKWIQETEAKICRQVKAAQTEAKEEQEKMKGMYVQLQSKVSDLKKTLTSHQKLMADVGALLRAIEKTEDLEVPDVTKYLITYRSFSDLLNSVLKDITEDLTDDCVRSIQSKLESLKEDFMSNIYDGLLDLATSLKEENIDQFKKALATQGGKDNKELATGSDDGKKRDVVNAEEKNSFALSVLRRVKIKLDGREPDVLRKASVSEQVHILF